MCLLELIIKCVEMHAKAFSYWATFLQVLMWCGEHDLSSVVTCRTVILVSDIRYVSWHKCITCCSVDIGENSINHNLTWFGLHTTLSNHSLTLWPSHNNCALIGLHSWVGGRVASTNESHNSTMIISYTWKWLFGNLQNSLYIQFAHRLFVTNGCRKWFYVFLTQCHFDWTHFSGDMDPISEISLCLQKQGESEERGSAGVLQRCAYSQGASCSWIQRDTRGSLYTPSFCFSFFYFIIENRKRVTMHPFPFPNPQTKNEK